MKIIESDIAEYRAAKAAHSDLYARLGTDVSAARNLRDERRAVNERLTTAAENLVMLMIGHHSPRLAAVGLLEMYKSIAAGGESLQTLLKIADETERFLGNE